METTDLLGDFASGDAVPAGEAPPPQALKRDQDSTDDFEHLEREGKRDEFESPSHQHGTARAATQNFLDMERDEFVDTPRAPSVTDKLADHIADKFTDSESEADTAGESPLHRPEPSVHVDSVPTPEVPKQELRAQPEPTPLQAATPAATAAPPPTPTPIVLSSTLPPKPVALPETDIKAKVEPATPAAEPVPKAPSQPAAPKAPSQPAAPVTAAPVPERKPEAVRAPTAHVIEAEVIFCQMGLASGCAWQAASFTLVPAPSARADVSPCSSRLVHPVAPPAPAEARVQYISLVTKLRRDHDTFVEWQGLGPAAGAAVTHQQAAARPRPPAHVPATAMRAFAGARLTHASAMPPAPRTPRSVRPVAGRGRGRLGERDGEHDACALRGRGAERGAASRPSIDATMLGSTLKDCTQKVSGGGVGGGGRRRTRPATVSAPATATTLTDSSPLLVPLTWLVRLRSSAARSKTEQ
ncbi:Zinc metalloprotease zmpB [Papilio machaon]|uniref:Zinc metalloprotease zmpB n=1 Tax=Papilio machaon TaxID=76193 RepID=A0A0N1IPB2_PAPMA|nr:Zinc metalloprotease zmpB [Papilio machaon]